VLGDVSGSVQGEAKTTCFSTGIFVTCLVYWKVSVLVEATVWFLEYMSGLVRQCLD
jgi:hypothetical protein